MESDKDYVERMQLENRLARENAENAEVAAKKVQEIQLEEQRNLALQKEEERIQKLKTVIDYWLLFFVIFVSR